MIPNATLKDDSQLLALLRSSKYRMCPEKGRTVSAAVKNSAEDSPPRAISGHYSRRPMFLIQFYPSRKKRARTADFSCPTTLIKRREMAIGRVGIPLHAESVVPVGVVALAENLAPAIFFRPACRTSVARSQYRLGIAFDGLRDKRRLAIAPSRLGSPAYVISAALYTHSLNVSSPAAL